MALEHATSGQVINLIRAAEDPARFAAIALAKTEQIELIRMVLPAGKEMPEHHVRGEITFQCLAGEIAFITGERSVTLQAGELLFLEGGAPHAVRALTDAVALVTIVLQPPP
ncbi:MAG: cupin domain-containing protein [Duganella sp.]